MKKKILLFVLLIFFCLFLSFFIFVNTTFNVKIIKQELNNHFLEEINSIKEHHNYKEKNPKFEIQGKISLKVFPKTKLIINNIEFKDIQYNNFLLSGNLEKIEIRMKFFDILLKNLIIKDLHLSNASILLERYVLKDSYLIKNKVKKLVKLEENEILGIKNKLKKILVGKDEVENKNSSEERFKEVIVEEDLKIDLDNNDLKNLLTKILFKIKMKNIEHGNFINGEAEFSNFNINLIKNSNIDKEFKNISGKIFLKNKNDVKTNFTLLISNISSKVSFELMKKNAESNINLVISNDVRDKIEFSYQGKENFSGIENILNLTGEKKISFETKSLNSFCQWLFPLSLDIYNKINYNNDIMCSVDFSGNLNKLTIKNIDIKSKDLLLIGNIEFSEQVRSLNLIIEKMNLNNFVLNTKKKQDKSEIKNIDIFNISNLDELNDFVKEKIVNNEQETKINIEIKELISGTNIIKDSKFNFEILNDFYHIENFNINIDNIYIDIKNKNKYKDIYINDLEIKGDDINKITKIFNFNNYLSFKDFKMNAKMMFFKNKVYIIDAKIDTEQQKVNGNFELSFIDEGRYFASDLHFDNMKIQKNKEKFQVKSLKESFLFLNNVKNNVFLKVKIDNLEYEDLFKNTYFESFIHYDNGLVDFYNIKNITNNNIKDLSGSFSINSTTSKPEIKLNINVDEVSYNVNILEFVLNINKYKNIILEEEKKLPELNSYWINKLFSIPLWTDINGFCDIKIKNLFINSKKLESFNFLNKINNGTNEIENLSFLGLGGNTKIKGTLDLKEIKSINLSLEKTIYNISDLLYIITDNESKNIDGTLDIRWGYAVYPQYKQIKDIDGTLGIRGTIKARGFNKNVFLSSMILDGDFIGNNLFIKKIGLEKLEKNLNERKDIKNIIVKRDILDNSGTIFKDFKGNISINKNLLFLKGEATNKNYSSNIILKIDNNGNKPLVNFNNISSFFFNVGDKNNQLYYSINFSEDFNNKAFLNINTQQIDDLVEILKEELSETK